MSDYISEQAQTALNEAVRLARHGAHLTPVTITRLANGKKRAEFHKPWGSESAVSSDPHQLTAWWVDHPDASFAVVCGPSGVEGVDLDVKPADGIDALEWWDQRDLPTGALVTRTLSGGLHHIWKRRADGRRLPNDAGQIAPGVDSRSSGGVFFAPGSYVVGEPGNYVIQGPLPHLADLGETPDAVFGLFAQPTTAKDRPADGSITTHDPEWMVAQYEAQLARVAEHGRGGGFRHVLLGAAMVAGRVVETGQLRDEVAVQQLHQAVSACWGIVDQDDVLWIEQGMRDGPVKERWRDLSFGLTVPGLDARQEAPPMPPPGREVVGPPTRAQLVGMLRKVLAADGANRTELVRWAQKKLRAYGAAGQLDPVYVGNVVEQLRQLGGDRR